MSTLLTTIVPAFATGRTLGLASHDSTRRRGPRPQSDYYRRGARSLTTRSPAGTLIARKIATLMDGALHHPSVARWLRTTRLAPWLYRHPWQRVHPFDRAHGTDTSGIIDIADLTTATDLRAHGIFYAGSQPSVVRAALRSLPDLAGFTFIDVGCGKGRAVLVADEFPFARLVGVDLSPTLLDIARWNLERVRHRRRAVAPAQPRLADVPIDFVALDATTYAFPPGDLVVYLYHPFDAPLMTCLVAHIEEALARDPGRTIFVVYCNPVAGGCFDASPSFIRRLAATLPYDEHERGFGPDVADPVIIWQGGDGTPLPAASAIADASAFDIIVEPPRRRVVLRRRSVSRDSGDENLAMA